MDGNTVINFYALLNFNIFQILQGGLNLGLLNPIGEGKVDVIDSFFLGGPLNFRGFATRGMGPKDGENYIGAKVSISEYIF